MRKKRKPSYKRRYIEEKKKNRAMEERLERTEKLLSDMACIAMLGFLMIEKEMKIDKQEDEEERENACEKGRQR